MKLFKWLQKEETAGARPDVTPPDPAFPSESDAYWYFGLSKRDYFAAAALTGLANRLAQDLGDGFNLPAYIVRDAYVLADAMLEERQK